MIDIMYVPELDSITVVLPRSTMQDVLSLSSDLNDRMHEMLERNTDGNLTALEKSELETLVRMAHVTQILSMALPKLSGL